MKKLIFYVSVASFLTIMPIGTKFNLNCEFAREDNTESVLHTLTCRDAEGNASLQFNLNNMELPPPPVRPVIHPQHHPRRHNTLSKCGNKDGKLWCKGKQYSTEKYSGKWIGTGYPGAITPKNVCSCGLRPGGQFIVQENTTKPKAHNAPSKCGLIKEQLWCDGKQYPTEEYKAKYQCNGCDLCASVNSKLPKKKFQEECNRIIKQKSHIQKEATCSCNMAPPGAAGGDSMYVIKKL